MLLQAKSLPRRHPGRSHKMGLGKHRNTTLGTTMNYRFHPNVEKVLLLFFNVGQALIIASLAYGFLNREDIFYAIGLAIFAAIFALIGTLEKKDD